MAFTVSFRYIDESEFRLYATGISKKSQLCDIVGFVGTFADVEDIRIGKCDDDDDLKILCP